ncbi:MAG: Na(+)-translocating NADH-quinone reductase subunit A [Deltaproteobacteria bacterium]|nr:Na(+)-translocating NADH-quinone reductase subunit A [Deltaproteobacteria bacterium]NND29053.1 Na(+)-translocating NADH-quinone reductase subunit A [Myxococcales bacterium]NNK05997.1 Na(+)-translocating NADH-quinone reductase subunit A [Myxococcales bacterium]NNK44839.1 Na(+)-translocating NADH-quinone reductase subunit A [Myxococcales bacterium]RZV52633.1 MAG: Na(+)-translocating NADH-quinone reductase subunit A [Deltaproteobacteria bacterium]
MHVRIRKGLTIPISGAPEQRIEDANEVGWVALVAMDFVGLQPRLMVDVGDRVRLGQPLLTDKQNPEVMFTSPGCGEIVAIHRGARRSLQSVVVRLDGEDEVLFPSHERTALTQLDRDAVRAVLQSSGLWTALRTRPYGKVPTAHASPHSIFVTAVDTNPLAGDPRLVIAERAQELHDGVAVLSRLTDGKVHICQAPGHGLELPNLESVRSATFEGPHPSGLPGTHIHFLDPVSENKSVWYLGYQDVIAIGSLFTTGRVCIDRVVALGGPKVKRPRLLRTRMGASTQDLLKGEIEGGDCRVISGSILGGRRAAGHARYLGPYDIQLSVLAEDRTRHFLRWVAAGADRYSSIRAFVGSLRPRRYRFALSTSQNGSPRAMVPIGNFEKVMPLDILPAPLLKALIVEDTETAKALGCLELEEEDLALCSFVCCSKYEYGEFLRANLELIEKNG